MSMVLSDGKALMQVSLWGAAAEIPDGMLRRVWIAAKSFHSWKLASRMLRRLQAGPRSTYGVPVRPGRRRHPAVFVRSRLRLYHLLFFFLVFLLAVPGTMRRRLPARSLHLTLSSVLCPRWCVCPMWVLALVSTRQVPLSLFVHRCCSSR